VAPLSAHAPARHPGESSIVEHALPMERPQSRYLSQEMLRSTRRTGRLTSSRGHQWLAGDFATGIRKAAPAARPTANFRIATTHALAQVNAAASARVHSVQPVRLPAPGRVSRPGTSTLVEATSIRSESVWVRRNGDSFCPKRGSASKAPRCWPAAKATARPPAAHRQVIARKSPHSTVSARHSRLPRA
jgi:hypothetical protein